jgi:CheY-like chemotaxis protein
MRILFIEDHKDTAEMVSEAASLVGIAVETCDNGAAALQLLDEKEYDAVILDLSIPVMDGLTIAEEIRMNEANRPHKKPVCIVFYTARKIDRAIVGVGNRVNVRAIYPKTAATDIFQMLEEIKEMCCEEKGEVKIKLPERGHTNQTLLVASIGVVALFLTVSYFIYQMNAQKRDFDNTLHVQQETAAYKWAEVKSQRDSVKNNCDLNAKDKETLKIWIQQQGLKPPPGMVSAVNCNYIEQK